jgi:hypothetical protein
MVISRCEKFVLWEVKALRGIHRDIQSRGDLGRLAAPSTQHLIRDGQVPASFPQPKQKVSSTISRN